MRKETMQNKMLELLGLDHMKIETDKKGRAVKKKKDSPVGVTDAELEKFREAQAISYFLQAPELFSAKTCPHCNETFLVSRQYVAFCSYTCIAKDLETKGIKWSRSTPEGFDIDEQYIKEVYDGNEPLWIRHIDTIRKLIDSVPEPSGLAKQT